MAKKTELSITLGLVDKATAGIKAVNARLAAAMKPVNDFKKALGDLRKTSGLDKVIDGFRGVGNALTGILTKFAVLGGVVAAAVHGMFKLVDEFDQLGETAEVVGVSVDFLAQMRFAAEKAGAPVEALDSGLKAFSQSIGQARAGTGRMAAFLTKVSPALLKQVKAAKSNEEAFDLMARAMDKIEDPAKRAALAQKVFGDAALAPLLVKGSKGIKALRDQFLNLAGPQKEAAEKAGLVDDAMKDFKATIQGVKAALVVGLAPALKGIVERLRMWFQANRGRIAEWAAGLGKRIPDAVNKLVGAFKSVVNFIRPFVDSATKLKIVGIAVAAIIAGPLISAIVSLGIALATNPIGLALIAIAALAVAWHQVITNWGGVRKFFGDFWDSLRKKFGPVVELFRLLTLPITGMAGLIMMAWGPISSFFTTLWEGVTFVFQKAWDVIKGIVDKVVGAVTTVKDAVGSVFSEVDLTRKPGQAGGKPAPDVFAQTVRTLDAVRAQASQAHVTIDLNNAPRGTRVKTDPQSTADIDLSVGYQMLGLAP